MPTKPTPPHSGTQPVTAARTTGLPRPETLPKDADAGELARYRVLYDKAEALHSPDFQTPKAIVARVNAEKCLMGITGWLDASKAPTRPEITWSERSPAAKP